MNLAVNARDAMPRGGTLTIETSNVELDDAYARLHAPVRPGRVRHARRQRHRRRHGRGDALAHLRAVLHHQGERQGHGARPRDGLRHRQAERRIHLGVQRAGERHDIQGLSATGRSEPPAGRGPGRGNGFRSGARRQCSSWKTKSPSGPSSRAILESYGYRVLEAAGAEEAIETVRGYQQPIHLLLTDVVMPSMGGPDLASRIQTLRPGVKVLYMSGYTDETVFRHGHLEQGRLFLQKPFTPEALARKLREALRT